MYIVYVYIHYICKYTYIIYIYIMKQKITFVCIYIYICWTTGTNQGCHEFQDVIFGYLLNLVLFIGDLGTMIERMFLNCQGF